MRIIAAILGVAMGVTNLVCIPRRTWWSCEYAFVIHRQYGADFPRPRLLVACLT
jgi:hypothetical protein